MHIFHLDSSIVLGVPIDFEGCYESCNVRDEVKRDTFCESFILSCR